MSELEDIIQPTEQVTRNCPTCDNSITAVPYDIGSGPELSCSNCEWCFGANGQDLQPLDVPALLAKAHRLSKQTPP